MLGKFKKQFEVDDLVKSFAKVQQDKVNLLTFNKLSGQFLNKLYELCFAWALFTETMLQLIQNLMIVEVPGNVGCNDMLHNLAKYAGERYWPIISWVTFVSLFEKWTYPSFGPITWKYSCGKRSFKEQTNNRCYFVPYLLQDYWLYFIRSRSVVWFYVGK